MIDDLLGRPSHIVKKYQVAIVSFVWIAVLVKGPVHGPKFLRKISQVLTKRLSAWQIHVLTMTFYYLMKNIDKIFDLRPPPPLKNVYSRSFYRASWILNALDAGFWTAMTVKPKWLSDISAILFSFYYLIFAEQADNKVRNYKSVLSTKLARISWEKASNNPYIKAFTWFSTPKVKLTKKIIISRPKGSEYEEGISIYIWFDGTEEELKKQNKIIYKIHGGGFISMTPLDFEPFLSGLAKTLKIPVVAIDYKKAPEYPFPYALDECFDAYLVLTESNGSIIDLELPDNKSLDICLVGDSAGGNLAVGTMLRILQSRKEIKHPTGIVLVYPALDLNYTCCLTEEQIDLIKMESLHEARPELFRRKTEIITRISSHIKSHNNLSLLSKSKFVNIQDRSQNTHQKPLMYLGEEDDDNDAQIDSSNAKDLVHDKSSKDNHSNSKIEKSDNPQVTRAPLSLTSKIAYSNDRILSPEMLRAVLLLYVGSENSSTDLEQNYYLSPVLSPLSLLSKFPKVCVICGEADPLVDDSMIFAARLRDAKHSIHQGEDKEFVEINILKGISHGFLQMLSILPESKLAMKRIEYWITDLLDLNKQKEEQHSASILSEGVKSVDDFEKFSDAFEGPKNVASSTSTPSNIESNSAKISDISRHKKTKSKEKIEKLWKEITYKGSTDVISERNNYSIDGLVRRDLEDS